MKIIGLIMVVCHWIACLWWAIGTAEWNLKASFGTSWIFRHNADASCEPLPDTDAYRGALGPPRPRQLAPALARSSAASAHLLRLTPQRKRRPRSWRSRRRRGAGT